MTRSDRTIFTNPLPSNVPAINFPHPIQGALRTLGNLRNGLSNGVQTAKGEFGMPGDTVVFSFRKTPALSRVRIEVVHPQDVNVFSDGKVIPVSQNEDDLFDGRFNSSSERVRARGVEKFSAIFTRDGNVLGTPNFGHHVQSVQFEGKITQDQTRGNQAGKFHGVDILEGLERFGNKFLESIEDPELRAKVAETLLGVRDLLLAPRELFGPDSALPSLSPDAMIRSREFNECATSLVQGAHSGKLSAGLDLA